MAELKILANQVALTATAIGPAIKCDVTPFMGGAAGAQKNGLIIIDTAPGGAALVKFQGTDRRQDGATPLSGDVNWADLPNAIAGLIATPVNQAFATASTGGTLVAATYYYRVSAINAYGETVASAETSQIVGAGTSTNTVTVNWLAIVGATGYKVYGRTTGAELLIATVTGQAIVTYVDTGALVPAGALPVNTANPPQTIEVSVPYWIRYNIVTLGTGVLTATLRGVQ